VPRAGGENGPTPVRTVCLNNWRAAALQMAGTLKNCCGVCLGFPSCSMLQDETLCDRYWPVFVMSIIHNISYWLKIPIGNAVLGTGDKKKTG